ncbi:unnamed protein product [Lactuca virosa]|uniref:Uncharacterized protein n=1 Tax=Lactuca virosa TaxID=75947 RepID=A0AAU9PRT5_9ASTR|nr:unnamed protein product [Lactuca virosa]
MLNPDFPRYRQISLGYRPPSPISGMFLPFLQKPKRLSFSENHSFVPLLCILSHSHCKRKHSRTFVSRPFPFEDSIPSSFASLKLELWEHWALNPFSDLSDLKIQ